jgi:hypothetical protein
MPEFHQTLSFRLSTKSPEIQKRLLRAHLLWNLGYRESAQTLQELLAGEHPCLAYKPDALPVMQRLVGRILAARSDDDNGTDGAVRKEADKLFGPLHNPESVALGLANDPDTETRATLLATPSLIRQHRKIIPGRTLTNGLFAGEPVKRAGKLVLKKDGNPKLTYNGDYRDANRVST